jgi:predicted Zn-dependent protease
MCRCHSRLPPRPPALDRRRFTTLLLGGTCSAALVACDPASVGQAFVSEAEVEELGLETWQRIKAEEPLSANQAHQRQARRITTEILTAIGEDPNAWEVAVFAGDQANAFALPGRKIGLYDGMFEMAGSEAQLAAVIGHEIGHVQADHSEARVARQLGTQAGLQLVSTALQIGDVGYANQIAGLLGAGAEYGILLPYSREQELEADAIGLRYMARAGYDPAAAVALWQNMSRRPSPPAFLSTHPAPSERIEALEEMIPEVRERSRGGG